MRTPLVSVIVPTHNRVGLLLEALDSIACQTVQDFEVIVIDDGSTEAVAEKVKDHPTRPLVLCQRRQGPAAARNRGVHRAAAGLVAFLDSDDLWYPTKLERFVEALESDPETRLFYGPMRPINARGEAVPGRTKPCHAGWITEKLFCSSFVHVPTVVCRKAVLVRAGGFDQRLPVCEDYDLWLRLSLDEPFGLVEEPLAMRRLHSDRLSKRSMSRNLAVKTTVLRRFYESHAANGHLRRDVCIPRLARVCLSAARAAFRGGDFQQAVEVCRTCRQYGGSLWRTLPLVLASRALTFLVGHGRSTSRDGAIEDQPEQDTFAGTTHT